MAKQTDRIVASQKPIAGGEIAVFVDCDRPVVGIGLLVDGVYVTVRLSPVEAKLLSIDLNLAERRVACRSVRKS